MEEYISLGEKLMPIASLHSEETEVLQELGKEELENLYSLLKKHLKNADYDEIDSLGEKLSAHRVPEDEKDRVNRILDAISTLEYDDLESILI